MTLRRISTVPALVVAAAVALAACGGSGHAHSTTADHRAPADSTSSTITTKVVTAATSTTPVGSSAASFPKEFVAVSRSTARPGVTEYSSTTGKPMRRLTDTNRDIDPMLADDGREVFYVHVPAKVCPVLLYRTSSSGGAGRRLATAGFPGGPVAVSADGRMLAYTGTTPGTCRLTHPNNWLTLRNLQTGQVHRIHTLVWGVAWAPGDQTLAVVAPDADGRGVIHLISDPFHATPAQVRSAPAIPCPDTRDCAETSPSFDAAGTLSYTAMISPHGARCWLSHCTGWTYALVTREAGQSRIRLSQRLHTDAVLPQSMVSAAGNAFIYTLPQGGGQRIWRWADGSPSEVAEPGASAIQAVWH